MIHARGGKRCEASAENTEGTRGTRSHNEINASIVVGPTEKWCDGSTAACELFLLEPEMKNPKHSYCKLISSVGITTRCMGWTVRGSNPGGGGDISRTRPARPWDPRSLL